MYGTSFLAVAFALISAASAVTIVPTAGSSTFPACAVQCSTLLQAQSTCAAAATELAVENCFCQSPSLGSLYANPDALCTDVCTAESDRQLLQTWFTGFCKEVGTGTDPLSAGGQTSATAAGKTTAAQTTAPTATASNSGNFIDGQNLPKNSNLPSPSAWWRAHYGWVIFLIVMFFGLLALGLGARYWKKRHARKAAERRAELSDVPAAKEKGVVGFTASAADMWGSTQHAYAPHSQQYPYDDIATGGAPRTSSKLRSQQRSNLDGQSSVQNLVGSGARDLSPPPHAMTPRTYTPDSAVYSPIAAPGRSQSEKRRSARSSLSRYSDERPPIARKSTEN